jgi:hypothetical protein
MHTNFDIEDAKIYLNDIKRLYQCTLQEAKEAIETILNLDTDESSRWFCLEYVKYFIAWNLPYLKSKIHQMERIISPLKVPSNLEKALEYARNTPIMEVAEHALQGIKRTGCRYIALCPFHQEKTPSFVLYPNSNTFHCYGCGANGDVISLVQNLNNYNFKEAVAYLSI